MMVRGFSDTRVTHTLTNSKGDRLPDGHGMGGHGGEFTIAGYNIIGGDWQNVETGGGTPFEDTGYDVDSLDRVTFHYIGPAGDDVYFTAHGPWDDWDSFVDYLEYIMDGYGVSE